MPKSSKLEAAPKINTLGIRKQSKQENKNQYRSRFSSRKAKWMGNGVVPKRFLGR